MTSARDQLAAAHRRMTPAEIAEHALVLATEHEALRRSVDTLRLAMNSAARTVSSVQGALQAQLELTYKIQALFEAHRKREAREMLRQAASTVYETEPVPLMETVDWSDELLNPFPERTTDGRR